MPPFEFTGTNETVDYRCQQRIDPLEVHLNTGDLDKSVDKLARLGRQILIAMMLVGMIVGSAIATSVIAFIQHSVDINLVFLPFMVESTLVGME